MTEEEIKDSAAESETGPVEAVGAAPDESAAESYTGRCVGGPWDTSDADVRFPSGFLLVHKPDRAVWVYDRRADGNFYCRSATPEPLDDARRMKAAEGSAYDIRVLDPKSVEPAVKPT